MTWRSSYEKVDVAWQCISERLWKCLVGRYGGCFEERYKEAYDDRAYHAKGLDAPVKYAPTLKARKGNARHRRGKKNLGAGSVNFRILTLVRRSHALIIGNSQSNQEVHKETSTPRGSVWGFGYPSASSTHSTWVYSNIRTLQRLVIHLVARVLNGGFWFSKNTRISQNTTSITNRLKLLTPKVQTLL